MGKNDVFGFFLEYGWAILVILVAIGALAYYGVLSPRNVLCGTEFCKVQYDAENSHNISAPFCELYVSNWNIAEKDEEARKRFLDECFCIKHNTPLTDAILNFTEEVILYLPQKIPSGVYKSKQELNKFMWDEALNAPCVDVVSKKELEEIQMQNTLEHISKCKKMINYGNLLLCIEYNESQIVRIDFDYSKNSSVVE